MGWTWGSGPAEQAAGSERSGSPRRSWRLPVDNWAVRRQANGDRRIRWKDPLRVARLVDADPWRDRLREPWVEGHSPW